MDGIEGDRGVTMTASWRRIPRGVWILGGVSLFMDISSEMIHSLLPLFLATGLGLSVLYIGILEGVAEATALITKIFSGILSDYLGKRKGLAVLGYGLGALSKPLFALASGAGLVFGARFMDRIGKGIRGAPRDALVADVTPPEIRGAAYGLRQSLDTFGAFLGPLLAVGLMLLWANDFRAVFWVAVIPAFIAVALLVFGLDEPKAAIVQARTNPLTRSQLRKLSAAFWQVALLGGVFTLARFSEAFLVLKAEQVGVPLALVPLVMVGMHLVFSLSAYPLGALSDRVSHRALLAWGLVLLILADLALAFSSGWSGLALGIVLWGLHMGMTQGLLAAMVARTAPAELRGTAFGLFNLVSGIALLLASSIAGALWHFLGSAATFQFGALAAVASLLVLAAYRRSLAPLAS